MLDGLSVIKVDFAGTERPYSSYGRYYKRVHDRAEDMTPDELKHMMLNTDYSYIWENNITTFGIEDDSTCSILEQVQHEGNRNIKRKINYYNLDMIISVGYRVKSQRGIIFRRWANKVLK